MHEPCSCWARALWTAAFPPETEMALAHFGRDISHPPRVPFEAVFNSLKAGIGGIWEKQRPESARVIWKSIYYAKMTKIVNLGLDQQFSPNNKVFFLNRYFQKKCCSFSFLRPKFSLGMLFRQFVNFPMSSCGPTVWYSFLRALAFHSFS